MGVRVAVAGASGYAGGELLRLIAGHPHLELTSATAHRHAGVRLAEVHPQLAGYGDLHFTDTDPQLLAQADLVFLALPHGQSATVAAQLPATTKVVDLGADHRLRDPDQWHRYYRGPHAGSWTYGLPELPGQRQLITAATRVAATGCYAVATILALAPLLAAGVAEPDDVVVVAASGTSGAGRTVTSHLLGSEVMGNLSVYKVGAHQHVPEIRQATGARSLSFTPMLAPMPRGILVTVTTRPAVAEVTAAGVRDTLVNAYRKELFVSVLPTETWPRTAAVAASNACHLQATVDSDAGRLIVTSAIDNLGKGAAGQAIQCANLMLGMPESAGLTANGVTP